MPGSFFSYNKTTAEADHYQCVLLLPRNVGNYSKFGTFQVWVELIQARSKCHNFLSDPENGWVEDLSSRGCNSRALEIQWKFRKRSIIMRKAWLCELPNLREGTCGFIVLEDDSDAKSKQSRCNNWCTEDAAFIEIVLVGSLWMKSKLSVFAKWERHGIVDVSTTNF